MATKTHHDVFKHLWQHYRSQVPDARKTEDMLKKAGETWIEDHVAFRTLPGPHTGSHRLEQFFAQLGYTRQDDYHFSQKQLKAFWMAPPDTDAPHPGPKVFISELIPDKYPEEFRQVVAELCGSVTKLPKDYYHPDNLGWLTTSATPWTKPTKDQLAILEQYSEYAAWTSVYGFQVNHFTVSVHLMAQQRFPTMEAFVAYLTTELGIKLNTSGGTIVKGTKADLLEQCATVAEPKQVALADGYYQMPYAFIEFAFRHRLPEVAPQDRSWEAFYQGFVPNNADKIFESTNRASSVG